MAGVIRGNVTSLIEHESSEDSFMSPHQSPKLRNNNQLRSEKILMKKHSRTEDDDTCLRLKGQMIFVSECDQMLFVCSPR